MKKIRHIVCVEANREKYGSFSTFKAAFDCLLKHGFELKSYKYEIRRFSAADQVKLLAVKRSEKYYTLHFRKEFVNTPLLQLF